MLGEEALARLPERGDHETTTFPALAAERKLLAFRHEGLWLTVNTPKDLRAAAEHVAAQPRLARRRVTRRFEHAASASRSPGAGS